MALAIASVLVLTGEVTEKFESQAEKTYEEYLKRSSEEKNTPCGDKCTKIC